MRVVSREKCPEGFRQRNGSVALAFWNKRVRFLDGDETSIFGEGEPVPPGFADLIESHAGMEGAKHHELRFKVALGLRNDCVSFLLRCVDSAGRAGDAGILDFDGGVIEAAPCLLGPREKRAKGPHSSFGRCVGEVCAHVDVELFNLFDRNGGARPVVNELAERPQCFFEPLRCALSMTAHGRLGCEEGIYFCVEGSAALQRAGSFEDGDTLDCNGFVLRF